MSGGEPRLQKKRGRLTTLRVSNEAEKGDIRVTAENHNSRRNEAPIINNLEAHFNYEKIQESFRNHSRNSHAGIGSITDIGSRRRR